MNSYRIVSALIGIVWIANGLFAKVLRMVPRHGAIVAKILGAEYAFEFTIAIGVSEILLAILIWSGKYARLVTLFQVLIILTMNCIEFFLANELLLWGRFNLLFAVLFSILILWNEFRKRREYE